MIPPNIINDFFNLRFERWWLYVPLNGRPYFEVYIDKNATFDSTKFDELIDIMPIYEYVLVQEFFAHTYYNYDMTKYRVELLLKERK